MQRGVDLAQFIEAEVPGRLSERCGSTALACSAGTRVGPPSMDTEGRNVAARTDLDVGAISQVDSGSRSGWRTTAWRTPACSWPRVPRGERRR